MGGFTCPFFCASHFSSLSLSLSLSYPTTHRRASELIEPIPTSQPLEPSDAMTGSSDKTAVDKTAADKAVSRPAGKADAIAVTVTGLGYDLVEVEHLPRGLLRVTIDRLPGRVYGTPGAPDSGEFITVEDCERVTRQLQYALEVAGLAYERLEVSSPGLDRLLKTEAHCHRFVGQAVSLTLKMPFQGRKHWTGTLLARESQPATDAQAGGAAAEAAEGGWRLVLTDSKADSALDFRFDEAREMRLVPVIDFKGRRRKSAPDEERAAAPAADASMNGEQDR